MKKLAFTTVLLGLLAACGPQYPCEEQMVVIYPGQDDNGFAPGIDCDPEAKLEIEKLENGAVISKCVCPKGK